MTSVLDVFEHQVPLFIDGESVSAEGGETFTTINPANEQELVEVAAAGPDDVDQAVISAQEGYQTWQSLTPTERGRRLFNVAKKIRENKDELARLESLDQGKPLSSAESSVESAARYMEFYAGLSDKINGDTIQLDGSWHAQTIHEPYGVSTQISPWNYPISQIARGAAPALAAGNAVVSKPAEQTPLTSVRLGQLAHEAGIPAGTLNVVPGFGPDVGEPLVTHEGVDIVTFTGSKSTGQAVMENAAESLIPITLELGGKSPAVVFSDANVDQTIDSLLLGILRNAGQTCSASSRLLVHNSLEEDIVEGFVERAEEYQLGPGVEDPDMGPLVSEEQFEKVTNYIEIGEQEGATLRAGGESSRPGYFVEPTIFTDVSHDMRIAQEEIFGPVITVTTFDTEEEAINLANDVDYGLVAGVFTSDYQRANRVARSIDAGQIYINDWFAGGVETPFGGYKDSGIGREKGEQAIMEYTQLKSINSRSFSPE